MTSQLESTLPPTRSARTTSSVRSTHQILYNYKPNFLKLRVYSRNHEKHVDEKQEVVLSWQDKPAQILHNQFWEMPHRFFYLALIVLVPKLWKRSGCICVMLNYWFLLNFWKYFMVMALDHMLPQVLFCWHRDYLVIPYPFFVKLEEVNIPV